MLPDIVFDRLNSKELSPKFPLEKTVIENLGKVNGMQLLALFQLKASYAYTQDKAQDLWKFLRQYLWNDEEMALFVAWEHIRFGRGKAELLRQIEEIRSRMERGLY